MQGRKSHEWAKTRMRIIDRITKDFSASKALPLEGIRVGICLHITKETSVLVMALKALGAEMALCSANPLSIQTDIACFLKDQEIRTFATRGESYEQYHDNMLQVIKFKPEIVTDDGAELHLMIHRNWASNIIGGTEETTSGVTRLKELEFWKKLRYPIIAVNNARTKFLFDNRYGTGQSTVDGLLRTTSVFLPGKHVIVCGYGWVGKGVASRLRGMGAIVTVTEIDPIRALEAHMEGYEVLPLLSACMYGDIFITCTGSYRIIRKEHIDRMKDGAILCNAGHFDFEIDIGYMKSQDQEPKEIRPNIQLYTVNGKSVYLLASGRVINLVGAEGHPPEVMALSFANQLLSIIYLAQKMDSLETKVYDVPEHIDHMISKYALNSFGIDVDQSN
ncbi:MAG: adenosylhomocysteinase [Nitrososphaeraceae archaeon]